MDGYEILSFLRRNAEPAVLATVVEVKGHAYRKAGAMMLLKEDGSAVGSVSPGCLESDLRERVRGLLRSGRSEIVAYDLRPEEDAVWGEAVGCGGALRILLEPVGGELRRLLGQIAERNARGEAVCLERIRADGGLRYKLAAAAGSEGGNSRVRELERGGALFFSQLFEPRPRLILFGAGRDADPIVRLAGRIGFQVAVADWRPSLVSEERFPGLELAVGSAAAIAERLNIGAGDYALLCGHQLQRDREMLELLLAIGPAYVGVMGSQSRIRHLFDGLPKRDFVHAPVGLSIGSEGAEEIAVSIAAELIAVRSGLRASAAGRRTEAAGMPALGEADVFEAQNVCEWR
ncbi:XdhC family protein [Cohnella algarum]|uniref:XdhC family protein n=1 Tax=Cohnella algarum TaxID=2044859 RepID=UPI00196787FD|nr:XdhC family protein [Cohnella algarum]MBN2983558.1 XdhC family protein [Cohnella algarum]